MRRLRRPSERDLSGTRTGPGTTRRILLDVFAMESRGGRTMCMTETILAEQSGQYIPPSAEGVGRYDEGARGGLTRGCRTPTTLGDYHAS